MWTRLVCLFACGPLVGCGRADPPPEWIPLARGFRAGPPDGVVGAWSAGSDLRARPEGSGIWIETSLPRPAWERDDPARNQWVAARPETDALPHQIGERVGLFEHGAALPQVEYVERNAPSIDTGDGLFFVSDERVFLRLPDGAEPPDGLVFASFLERGREENGAWRAIVGDLIADGLSVWPGERAERVVDIPPKSVLRFQTALNPLASGGAVTFRIELDGEPLFAFEEPLSDDASDRAHEDVHHEVTLPREGRRAARLVFRVDGTPATAGFLAPVVGPADPGAYGARPWESPGSPDSPGPPRPDVVLFVADTFRADLLSAWGGDPEVAPHLNRLVERSVRFLRARSTSVWTLPSHGSLFTGVQTLQHGAVHREVALPRELTTIAERLAGQDYRTGAVTDSGFVSRHFAMDQGFEWFRETAYAQRDLRRTLARAVEFLDRDDGRPIFLFVHTYRTHQPYRIGAEEDTGPFYELMTRVRRRLKTWDRQGDLLDVLREYLDEFHGLYRDGAHALDAQFGPWFAELERRGLFERGYFVLTSDHGDEFLEHGRRYHHGAPHEEKIRVPLLIHGGGLAPRAVRYGASLVDVAPTIAELCGLAPQDVWVGGSLLGLDRERPLAAYNVDDGETYLAVFQGERKVFSDGSVEALERGELSAAYDLAVDPAEQEDVLGRELAWPAEMGREFAPRWAELSRPLATPEDAQLSEELRERLRELGYAE